MSGSPETRVSRAIGFSYYAVPGLVKQLTICSLMKVCTVRRIVGAVRVYESYHFSSPSCDPLARAPQ